MNRARADPTPTADGKGFRVATRANGGGVSLYEMPRPGAFVPVAEADVTAEAARTAEVASLSGLAEDGFALSWATRDSWLAAGDNGGRVAVWDTQGAPGGAALASWVAHGKEEGAEDAAVGDCSFHSLASAGPRSVLGTVGDDGYLRMWDVRAPRHGTNPGGEASVLARAFRRARDRVFCLWLLTKPHHRSVLFLCCRPAHATLLCVCFQ